MIEPTAEARLLAERALRAADYDWERLFEVTGRGLLFAGQPRHGVRCLVVRDDAMPAAARDALLAWRLAQYLLVNFYDTGLVAQWEVLREPCAIGSQDSHAMAFDAGWRLVAYSALRRPLEMDSGWGFADAERPALLPCEAVHGRAWQRDLRCGHDIPLSRCCEIGRSMSDRSRRDTATHRAPVELALLGCRLIHSPRYEGMFRLVAGDLDPRVILRNLRYFFVPVATWPARTIDLGPGHPLRPRYLDNPTSPFLVLLQDIGPCAFRRWADIDGALELEDEQALPRLLALSQFVSLRRSSCQPGRDVGEPPGSPAVLGPGQEVDRDRAVLVVEGCLQAVGPCPGGRSHLASLGPETAFVPRPGLETAVAGLRAVTPARVRLASPEELDAFAGRRQEAV
jgi:hypothetical protein